MKAHSWKIAVSTVLTLALAIGVAQLGGVSSNPPAGEPQTSPDASAEFQRDEAERPAERFLVETSGPRASAKLDDSLDEVGASSGPELGGNWHAVTLNDSQTAEELKSELAAQGVQITSIEPEQSRVPTSLPATYTPSAGQWALDNAQDRDINAPEAWRLGVGSPEVRIAVIDSGVDGTHPDLSPVVLAGQTFNGTQSPATVDGTGHGTAIAGVIAAQGQSVVGLAPRVRIVPFKVFENGDGTGRFSMSGYIAAIDAAIASGVRVINLSVGCPRSTPACFSQAEYDALKRAREAGVLVTASAGNNDRDNDAVADYPSGYDLDNIISVGAADRSLERASFSQWGKASVDLLAPGVDIKTTQRGGGTALRSGTSFAAPLVAATAGLIIARDPDMKATDVRARILENVRPVAAVKNDVASGGVLDAAAAVAGQRPTDNSELSAPTGAVLLSPRSGASTADQPSFSWRTLPGHRATHVDLGAAGKLAIPAGSQSLTTPVPLRPGRYTWRVRTEGPDGPASSEARTFTVRPTAAVRLSRRAATVADDGRSVVVRGQLRGNLTRSKLSFEVRYKGRVVGTHTRSVRVRGRRPTSFTERIRLSSAVPTGARVTVIVTQRGSGSTARARTSS